MFKINDCLFKEDSLIFCWYDGPLIFATKFEDTFYLSVFSTFVEYLTIPIDKSLIDNESEVDLHQLLNEAQNCYLLYVDEKSVIKDYKNINFEEYPDDSKPRKESKIKLKVVL